MKELSEKNIRGEMNSRYKDPEAEESVLWSRSSKGAGVIRR